MENAITRIALTVMIAIHSTEMDEVQHDQKNPDGHAQEAQQAQKTHAPKFEVMASDSTA